jgi:hypothetical protein
LPACFCLHSVQPVVTTKVGSVHRRTDISARQGLKIHLSNRLPAAYPNVWHNIISLTKNQNKPSQRQSFASNRCQASYGLNLTIRSSVN